MCYKILQTRNKGNNDDNGTNSVNEIIQFHVIDPEYRVTVRRLRVLHIKLSL